MHIIKRLNHYFLTHQTKNLHAVKYTLAFSLGYLATLFTADHYSVWILITIAVVMANQPIVGQILQKSFYRVVGTFVGAVFGVCTFFLPQSPTILFITVVVASLIMTRLFAFRSDQTSQVAVLGLVTFSLVMFLAHQSLHFAVMRVIDTLIGIVIALFVSRFVFPMTSKHAFVFALKETATCLAVFAEKVFIEGVDRRNDPGVNQLENRIVQALTKMRTLIRSGRYESIQLSEYGEAFNILVRYFRAIYHYLIFLDVAVSEIAERNLDLSVKVRKQLALPIENLMHLLDEYALSGQLSMEYLKDFKIQKNDDLKLFISQYHAIEFVLRRIPFCLGKINSVELDHNK